MQQRQAIRNALVRAKGWIQEPIWKFIWPDHISFLWYDTKNWGDALNPVLIEHLSGKKAKGIDINIHQSYWVDEEADLNAVHYLVIGSTLHHADRQTIVWGAGFTGEFNQFRQPPRSVLAVRGPLSAQSVRKQGVDCPNTYGDPALLLPRFYQPQSFEKKFKLGIIPHFYDFKNPNLQAFKQNPDVLVINIKSNIKKVVDQLCSCEKVVSSSLHGLIAADAYQIPSKWILISNRIPGKNFKFHDYYASCNFEETPLWLSSDTSWKYLSQACSLRKFCPDLDQLLEVCPFADSTHLV